MGKYSGLGAKLIFQPQVATFVQGIVVLVPLQHAWLEKGTTGEMMQEALSK
jgi:N-acetyl-gamma-glutamylphosphate reductase